MIAIMVKLAQEGGISAKGWVKKGYYVLMGIVMDCFCWVMFDLLQTLFRLGPRGPKGMGSNLLCLQKVKPNPTKAVHNYVRMMSQHSSGPSQAPAGLGDY